MNEDDRFRRLAARRAFLQRSLALAGSLLAGGSALRGALSFGTPDASPEAASSPTPSSAPATKVLEARFVGLRGEEGTITRTVLEDAVLGLMQLDTGEYPLDALSSLFPDDPPISIRVDARSGRPETTTVLATRLASALKDMGSKGDAVVVADASDADLKAAGYRLVRDGEGPLCHGDEPKPGYGDPRELPGIGKGVRLSRALDEKERRIAVVARLHARDGRMGPFVLDAALRAFDPSTRKKVLKDPELGARLLASPPLGGRVSLVIGDLFAVELGQGPAAESSAGNEEWKADVLLSGRNLFAVERIGYTILSNTMKARGREPLPEPPLLAAATALGLSGARMSSINWRKASL
jgi:hypothetical protein